MGASDRRTGRFESKKDLVGAMGMEYGDGRQEKLAVTVSSLRKAKANINRIAVKVW